MARSTTASSPRSGTSPLLPPASALPRTCSTGHCSTSRAAPPMRETNTESLEPISKSPEEDNKAGELDKAEEVLGVVLPADEDATLPLYPSEETLDEPPSHITAQAPTRPLLWPKVVGQKSAPPNAEKA